MTKNRKRGTHNANGHHDGHDQNCIASAAAAASIIIGSSIKDEVRWGDGHSSDGIVGSDKVLEVALLGVGGGRAIGVRGTDDEIDGGWAILDAVDGDGVDLLSDCWRDLLEETVVVLHEGGCGGWEDHLRSEIEVAHTGSTVKGVSWDAGEAGDGWANAGDAGWDAGTAEYGLEDESILCGGLL